MRWLLVVACLLLGCKEKLDGCLPIKPDLKFNLFVLSETNPWLTAFIPDTENRCAVIQNDGVSGGCLLPDDSLLLYEVSAAYVESSTTTTNVKEVTTAERWTVMSKRARDGHRDEKCVEEFINQVYVR